MSLLAWLKETHSRVLKLLAMVFHPLEKMKCREKKRNERMKEDLGVGC